MKILSILTYYAPHWTGLTMHAQRVAEGLAARGHEVTVLTTRHSLDLPIDEVMQGVRVIRLQPIARISRGMVAPAFPLAAAKLIRSHDIVHVHTPQLEALLASSLCKLLGRPLLMTHHGDLIMPDGPINRVIEAAVTGQMLLAGKLATAVSAYSRDYAANSAFLQHFKDKLTYIYPPVELPAPQPDAVAAWKTELGLDGRPVVGFAGRFVEEKGFDFLLEAMPLIAEAFPEVRFVFAGEHKIDYEDFYSQCLPLIEQNQERLVFVGLLRDPQKLANFYAMCDVFTLPSRSDCLAMVQIEALLAGVPLVTSDIPGARVVVRETGFGRLVAPRNPPALAEGIIEVLRHPDLYAVERSRVDEVFSTASILDAYETTLQGMIADFGLPAAHPEKTMTSTPPPATARAYAPLAGSDAVFMDRMLRNEADPAYSRRARRLMEYLALEDGDRVLDCGCGYGFYTLVMSQLRDATVVGFDGAFDRLQVGQEHATKAGFVCGDGQGLPFNDNSFDKILLSEVLEHIPDEQAALVELYRILKPGGVLAISVPHSNYPLWWDPVNWIWTRLGGKPFTHTKFGGIWENHVRLYQPDELVNQVARAGFTVECCEEATHYAVPLTPYVVYGIGKPLIESNLLPKRWRGVADRMRGGDNAGNPLNPLNLARSVINRVDSLNEDPATAEKASFVNVFVKARKPL